MAMNPERWKQIDELFSAALEIDQDKRAAFLDQACAGDDDLRKELETLLASDEKEQSRIQAYPMQMAAELLAKPLIVLSPGKSIGPYKILSLIGSGGMGDVYRANDPRIGREVAVKVLPPHFSNDSDRMRRFQQEVRAAGMLNHQNIVTTYDSGMENGSPYLVSELLRGESLRQKLKGAPLTIRKAIEYALQIARGLSAAHEKGIVHRDLKPENIFITREGSVKILDFGLAKLTHPEGSNASLDTSGSASQRTDTGVVVGTVVYMSPEQVRGAKVDHRSDIFAFGAVLYEMLSGNRPFQGETQVEVMHAILKSDPPELSQSNSDVPPALERIARRCLEKHPDHRFQTASDLGFALDTLSSPLTTGAAVKLQQNRKRSLIWILTSILLVAAAALGSFLYPSFRNTSSQQDAPVQRLSVLLPENSVVDAIAFSPDGKFIAYTPIDEHGEGALHVRSLDSTDAEELAGTEDATLPFWSPDSRSIGFFSHDTLRITSLGGGNPKDLCDVESPKGGTWNKENVILFAQRNVGGLFRISASGGEPIPVTHLDDSLGEWTHRFPQFLPDGKHFFYWIGSAQEGRQGEFVGSLDSPLKKRLRGDVDTFQFVHPGMGLFVVNRRLMAQPFDITTLEFQGEAVQLAPNVESGNVYVPALFSASATNVLGYRDTAGVWASQPQWFDRTGKPLDKWNRAISLSRQPDHYKFMDLSIDEKYLLLNTNSGNGVWILDLLTHQFTRFAITNDSPAIFSRDGSHVIYIAHTKDGFDANQRSMDGSGKAELLFHSKQGMDEPTLSRDGRFLLFTTFDVETTFDIWVSPFFGDRTPFPYLQTPAKEEDARFSPNGKWIAYVSDESGVPQVYVRSFPLESGGKWQISFDGGQQPEWRTDGRELFYMTLDKNLMATDVKTEEHFQAGTPHLLFKTGASPHLAAHANNQQYYAADNGQRFLTNTIVPAETPAQITILLNWQSLLNK